MSAIWVGRFQMGLFLEVAEVVARGCGSGCWSGSWE